MADLPAIEPDPAMARLCALNAEHARKVGHIDEEITWRRAASLLLPAGGRISWTKPEIRSVAG